MDRRDFLKSAGLASAAAMVPWRVVDLGGIGLGGDAPGGFGHFPGPYNQTTLAQTIIKGADLKAGSKGTYFQLAYGPGEPHLPRTELAQRTGENQDVNTRRSLLHFAHFTDVHIIDAQSPARVEFLDRYNDPGNGCEGMPFNAAQRAQETLSVQVLEAMVRRLRAIEISPITGTPIQSVVSTGDNVDNEQFNELRWFIDTLDGGGKIVTPNSGGPGYEGVQNAEWADPEYWHPDPGVTDKYKQQWGFPDYEGLLQLALSSFSATGVGVPWYQTFGNHDGLLQGNAPRNDVFEAIAVGPLKIMALPPGVNPCDSLDTLRNNPEAFASAPVHPVTADPDRKIVTRAQYIEEMFNTTGNPGHGFTETNRTTGVAYWHNDDHDGFRFIGLDTVPPGGYADGNIGAAQLAWLEARLIEVSSKYRNADGDVVSNAVQDRYVILFSHHGLRSLDSPNAAPNPREPASNDLPRVMSAEVEALVHRFPNVIAWVNGHTHENIVEPRPNPAGGGFWDIGTAAHIDWSCQARLIEVLDNRDGTLSIYCTMFDHAAPAVPGAEPDDILRMASISRELCANDFQFGYNSNGGGEAKDRNVELIITAPFTPPGSPGSPGSQRRHHRHHRTPARA